MIKKIVISFTCLLILSACSNDYVPKQKAYLRLEYPINNYDWIQVEGYFRFKKSIYSTVKKIKKVDKEWFDINYPEMNATISLTYYPIEKNLKALMKDAEKLTYVHTIKAEEIITKLYTNKESKVYGIKHNVTGNSASNSQFYLTDSVTHFIMGSLYFNSRVNYDSVYPALKYIEKDIQEMIESFRWE